MKNLRKKAALFFLRNNRKGIRNLMLYIAIGNAIVWLFSMFDPSNMMYSLLCFDRSRILQGQVWRLISYIFTYIIDAKGFSLIMGAISLVCYAFIGRFLEQAWGVLKFNAYYLLGVIMTDIVGMLIGYDSSTYYINLSLFLAIATIAPDTRFLLFYIIPVKAKYLAWVELAFVIFDVLQNLMSAASYGFSALMLLYCLYPIVSLLNYALFFGKDMKNLLPDFAKRRRTRPTQSSYGRYTPPASKPQSSAPGYRHRCTVCGKTDVSDPNMEFRYCSKCAGFYCYCADHINNHTHIVN